MRDRRHRVALVASLAVTAFGCALLAVYVRQFQKEASGGAPVALLAMRKTVSAGEPLDEQMLIAHFVPESYVESRQVLASDISRVLGVRAAIDLEADQTLAWTDLVTARRSQGSLSTRVPQGMRAMSIEQPRRKGLTQLLRPGDRVDVLLTRSKSALEERAVTIHLLQNVLVLSVGTDIGPVYIDHDRSDSHFVTLLVSVDQASLLAHATRGGDLNLILRNEGDLEINDGLPETSDLDVFLESNRSQRQRRPIEKVH